MSGRILSFSSPPGPTTLAFSQGSNISTGSTASSQTTSVKRRGVGREWVTSITTQSKEDAEGHFPSQQWKRLRVNYNKKAAVLDFQCKFGNCPKLGRIRSIPESTGVTIYAVEKIEDGHIGSDHDHSIMRATKGMSEEQKDIVKACVNRHQGAPKMVQAEFRRLQQSGVPVPPIPTKTQIASFTCYEACKLRGSAAEEFTSKDLEEFTNQHCSSTIRDLDTPYVCGLQLGRHNPDAPGKGPLVRICMTTRRLLLLNVTAKDLKLHIDATYSLNREGYPLQVLGQDDADKKFHTQMFTLSKHEEKADFQFTFECFEKERRAALDYCIANHLLPWEASNTRDDFDAHEPLVIHPPVMVMADGSEAAPNGFKKVWPSPHIRLMCYCHVYMNCSKKANSISDKCTRDLIVSVGINLLSIAWTPVCFRTVKTLFINKYTSAPYDRLTSNVPHFIEYFVKQWCDDRYVSWYRGCAPNHTMSNAGMEACNKIIKDEITFHQRIPCKDLLKRVMLHLEKLSKSYIVNGDLPDPRAFITTRTLTLRDFQRAHQWNESIIRRCLKIPNEDVWVSASSACTGEFTLPIARQYLARFREFSWTSFDQYCVEVTSICVITRCSDRSEGFTCTCRGNAKDFKCKHTIGIALSIRELQLPAEAAVFGLGRKLARGRPPKTTGAWSLPALDLSSVSTSSSSMFEAAAGLENLNPNVPLLESFEAESM